MAAPLALPTPSVETPGGETVARDSQSEVKVIISFARCHFSCLIILVIILLWACFSFLLEPLQSQLTASPFSPFRIPLVLLIYAASVYNSASDYIGSVFISSIGSDRYSLGGGYEYSYYGYSTPSICSGGGYDCELSDPDVLSSFSYWAGPIIAVLVLGWILIASTICLAVLVCMHRGARRRKSRGSGDNTNGNGSRENENPLEMIQTPQTQHQSQVQGMYYGHPNQSNQSQQGGYEMGQIREGNDATVYNQAEASSMGQPRWWVNHLVLRYEKASSRESKGAKQGVKRWKWARRLRSLWTISLSFRLSHVTHLISCYFESMYTSLLRDFLEWQARNFRTIGLTLSCCDTDSTFSNLSSVLHYPSSS